MHVYTYRNLQNPEGTLNPLELDFRAVVSCLALVLGTKLRSFEEQAASSRNPDPSLQILDCLFSSGPWQSVSIVPATGETEAGDWLEDRMSGTPRLLTTACFLSPAAESHAVK